ncbi:prolyl 4-hydroxylase subunit alpha-2 isoform X2 [Scaptodrosophila lebanonensis]|nr:prolyl 4-hydroxylase subunit alpha-2 isoform X2 [Scaptodrosophila lebanonensis]
MKKLRSHSKTQSDSYTSNVFYQYRLTRHMHQDWPKWLKLMAKKLGAKQIASAQSLHPLLPTETDLSEALLAIYRLQTTYKLKAKDMVAGILKGKYYSHDKWGVIECSMLGLFYFYKERYTYAIDWLKLALKLYKHSNAKLIKIMDWTFVAILEILVEATRISGRYKAAYIYANRTLARKPNDDYMKRQVEQLKELSQLPLVPNVERNSNKLYKKFCNRPYPPIVKGVSCHYLRSTPFLKLAPIKMEVLSQDPSITYYHGLLSDVEASTLKNLSRPLLHRAEFFDFKTNLYAMDYYGQRTCKTARLDDHVHEVTEALNQRVSHVTGLLLTDSEKLQIINYGMSGHIHEHIDASKRSSEGEWETGDRTATALAYLTDVEQGGETVFPLLNITVVPRKGSVMVFYNLQLNSQADERTLHVSCPIIFGDKWIATKWIRDKAQMFIRPCPIHFKPLPKSDLLPEMEVTNDLDFIREEDYAGSLMK